MFKPGDQAIVAATKQPTVITAVLRDSTKVETVDGTFEEADLLQGHPTVLDNANPKYVSPAEQSKKLLDEAGTLTRNYELRDEVSSLLRESGLELDFRGHWRNGKSLYDPERLVRGILANLFLFGYQTEEDLQDLKNALTSKTATSRWINLGRSIDLPMDGCSYCGVRRLTIETNGMTLRLTGDDCPLPNGFEPNVWELNVPSGKIVVANDLRNWFPLPDGDGEIASLNTAIGLRQTAQAYAAVGMAHGFVGNSCPGIFRLNEGKFKICNEPSDEIWDAESEEWIDREDGPPFEGESVGRVVTDLWWYSLCDADEFERRTAKFGQPESRRHLETIDVKPGVYRFTHFDESNGNDDDERVYATFEWVREADPVKDFLKEWESVDVNPNAYVQAQVRRWPTLYGAHRGSILSEENIPWSEMTEEQKYRSWQRVADHTFCTIGGGVEWHEKGFPQSKVDPEIPDIEPPSFREQYHWYPFSKGYGGLFEPEKLSPSFAKLAFRVLESVISFGMHVRDDAHSREVLYTRERMMLAVERYRELAEKYPLEADPDYVWWLSQEGRAEAWVQRFDLGPIFTEKHRKNAEAQRWIPEGTYAIEFDARKLDNGPFAWAEGHWSSKENAERYAIEEWHDNGRSPEHNCCWMAHAKNTAIPLYSVARVVKLGEVSHTGGTIVELAFDYGTPWMQDATKRKGVYENSKQAIRLLTREEYEKLLPKAEKFFVAKPKQEAAKKAAKKAT
jgi:hypothetical protein